MNETLYERFFGGASEDIKREHDEALRVRTVIRELVTHQAYGPHLRDWLDEEIERNSPKPDTHEGMLYQVGKRDGLQAVKGHLQMLEREAERHPDE